MSSAAPHARPVAAATAAVQPPPPPQKFDFTLSQTTHFASIAEITAYVNWINTQLSADPALSDYLPIPASDPTALFEACKDGILLCKLINNSVPGTVQEKGLIFQRNVKNQIQVVENLQRAIDGAIKIGVHVHNLSAEDIMKGTQHLVLGLVWQVIKIGLLQDVNPAEGLSNANSLDNLSTKVAQEQHTTQKLENALLKWVNTTIRAQGPESPTKIYNFGSDLKDSVALAYLLASLDNSENAKDTVENILSEQDLDKRAELVLNYAERFDCRHFATAADIVDGNKNLNLAFVAVLHNLKVSRDKATQERLKLEGAKENAEAALLSISSTKENELKALRSHLRDAKDEVQRVYQENASLKNDLEHFAQNAEKQRQVNDENQALQERLSKLREELYDAHRINEQVSKSFDIVTSSLSVLQNDCQTLSLQNEEKSQLIEQLRAELQEAKSQIDNLQASNAALRQFLLEIRDENQNFSTLATTSYESLGNLANSSAPQNSLNNLASSQNDLASSLSEQLQASQKFAQDLQYQLLALQNENDQKARELELAIEHSRQIEKSFLQQTQSSVEDAESGQKKLPRDDDPSDESLNSSYKHQPRKPESPDQQHRQESSHERQSKAGPPRNRFWQQDHQPQLQSVSEDDLPLNEQISRRQSQFAPESANQNVARPDQDQVQQQNAQHPEKQQQNDSQVDGQQQAHRKQLYNEAQLQQSPQQKQQEAEQTQEPQQPKQNPQQRQLQAQQQQQQQQQQQDKQFKPERQEKQQEKSQQQNRQAENSSSSLAQAEEQENGENFLKNLSESQSKSDAELARKQSQLQQSIDTLCGLQLLLSQDLADAQSAAARDQLLQNSIRQMQELSVNLMLQTSTDSTAILQRVFDELRSREGFQELQSQKQAAASEQDFVNSLAAIFASLSKKAQESEKKVTELKKSVDTLNFELERVQLEKPNGYRDADIESSEKFAETAAAAAATADGSAPEAYKSEEALGNDREQRREEFARLKDEKENLQIKLDILERTTAAILRQRSALIEENNGLKNQNSADAQNFLRQIESLDTLLAENTRLAYEIRAEEGDQQRSAAKANAKSSSRQLYASQKSKIQKQIDAMLQSEDCLIDDLNRMKESNECLKQKLEDANQCIKSLMAQRTILLSERESLQAHIADSNSNLSRSHHNNSFASAPNLS
ncbi:phospholipid scramblase 1 [Entophlyctis luteolus]|nr:phospholipid scramblase 1 [Entophlyctis luteolus]